MGTAQNGARGLISTRGSVVSAMTLDTDNSWLCDQTPDRLTAAVSILRQIARQNHRQIPPGIAQTVNLLDGDPFHLLRAAFELKADLRNVGSKAIPRGRFRRTTR
jgi:hypothetical protein